MRKCALNVKYLRRRRKRKLGLESYSLSKIFGFLELRTFRSMRTCEAHKKGDAGLSMGYFVYGACDD